MQASGASRAESGAAGTDGVHGLQDVDHGAGCGVDWSVWSFRLDQGGYGWFQGTERRGLDTMGRRGRRWLSMATVMVVIMPRQGGCMH